MNNRRSFFKSLATLGAAAVGCPGIFIPKLEPVKWKRTAGILWEGQRVSDFFGKWQFVETTYRLEDDLWVPDDKLNFVPYPNTPVEVKIRHGGSDKIMFVNPAWS